MRKDSCTGDSGGPLWRRDGKKGRATLVGLVSYGPKNCGGLNGFGVYTRISAFVPWIRKHAKSGACKRGSSREGTAMTTENPYVKSPAFLRQIFFGHLLGQHPLQNTITASEVPAV